jgi:anti-sigma factor RsiW
MTELTCRDVVEFLVDYLDHELDPAQRHAFEAHLTECDECVAYIRSYEQAVRLGQAAFEPPEAPAEAHVPAQLVRAVLAARRRGSRNA